MQAEVLPEHTDGEISPTMRCTMQVTSLSRLLHIPVTEKVSAILTTVLCSWKRFADEIVSLFGPEGTRHEVPGHEEVELALVKFATGRRI